MVKLDMQMHNEQKDETQLPSACILAIPLLYAYPSCLLYSVNRMFLVSRIKRLLPVRWARQVVWAGWLCVSPRVPAQST